MNTRTGNFPIGFRLGWTQWYKDFPAVVKWAKDNGFAAIDINGYTPEISNQMQAAGLRIGSVDLLDFGKLVDFTTDEGDDESFKSRWMVYQGKGLTRTEAEQWTASRP